MTELPIEAIAEICHEANRQYCLYVMDDNSQSSWQSAPDWQRESAIKGVQFILDNPNTSSEAVHQAWMDQKLAEGWVYGEEKDAVARTHPCLVSYGKLPIDQQRKDEIFRGIVYILNSSVRVSKTIIEALR